MKNTLKLLFAHEVLDEQTAYSTLTAISEGQFSAVEVASFLTVYQMRSITLGELRGFRNALLDLCQPMNFNSFDPIDMCGTGGDGKDTFNISTLASIVVAGAGYKVAKHGNNGVSSPCGSSNVIQALGYQFSNDSSVLERQLDEAGITFLHAPLFHPAMKEVAPIRKELGVKTFFNMLGPMVNPSQPRKQLVGVYSLELARLYNYLYQLEDKDYVILHSLDGYDEVSLTSEVQAVTKNGTTILSPQLFSSITITPASIAGGGSIAASAKLFSSILNGNGSDSQNAVVCANAALAIQCCTPELSLEDCFAKAETSLLSGQAKKTFSKLLSI